MNSMAKSVLPHPGPPLMSAGLPFGRPPPVISSNPFIPDGTFSRSNPVACDRPVFTVIPSPHLVREKCVQYKNNRESHDKPMRMFQNLKHGSLLPLVKNPADGSE